MYNAIALGHSEIIIITEILHKADKSVQELQNSNYKYFNIFLEAVQLTALLQFLYTNVYIKPGCGSATRFRDCSTKKKI